MSLETTGMYINRIAARMLKNALAKTQCQVRAMPEAPINLLISIEELVSTCHQILSMLDQMDKTAEHQNRLIYRLSRQYSDLGVDLKYALDYIELLLKAAGEGKPIPHTSSPEEVEQVLKLLRQNSVTSVTFMDPHKTATDFTLTPNPVNHVPIGIEEED